MKRKIFNAIKQKLCRHRYEFVECDSTRSLGFFPSWYFLYRCEKCGKSKIIYCHRIEKELEDVYPEKVLEYPKEVLWLPRSYEDELTPHKYYSREAGYLVSKYYNEYGILLTAWGNREFGPKTDQDDIEMRSDDEIKREIAKGADNGVISVNDAMYIISRMEYVECMKRNGL